MTFQIFDILDSVLTCAITGTMIFAAGYFVLAFISSFTTTAPAIATTPATVESKALPEPKAVTRTRGLSSLIREEAVRPKSGTVAKVDHTYDIPSSIRGLRDYVRTNGLQEAVKARLGKTVSKATKAELIAALGAI